MAAISRRRELLPLLLVAALLSAASAFGIVWYAQFVARAPFPDFQAFYCASRVLASHADPYLQQPLAACEAPFLERYFPAGSSGVVIPAPLPGYALAVLIPLALLPFGAASTIWLAVLAASVAGTVAALRSLTGLPLSMLAAIVLTADGFLPLALGQTAPLAVLGIALTALALRADRPRLAVAVSTAVWLVPQAALPLAAALFLYVRQTRIAIGVQIAALALLTAAILGVPVAIEYAKVLASQAGAEYLYAQQIALAPELVQLGVSPTAAAISGIAVWAAACTVGVVLASRLASAGPDAAWIAVVPPVFALFGGTYLHPVTLAVALPALSMLFVRSQKRPAALAALLLLAIPWMPSGASIYLWPFFTLTALLAAREVPRSGALQPLIIALVCALALALSGREVLEYVAAHGHIAPVVVPRSPRDLAEVSWAAIVRSAWAPPVDAGVWAARAAAFGGILLAGVLMARATFRSSRRVPISGV